MGTAKRSCKTAAVMNLLNRGPAVDRTVQIQSNQMRDIDTITQEILDAKRAGGEAILAIGRGLMEAKTLLSHGKWLPWLEERVEFSEKAAQNFMRIARHYSNPQALADLGSTKALMLLAVPDEAREEFISTPHQVNGEEKTVIDMTSRELDAAIKERDAALRAAEQAEADQRAADEAREKLSQEISLANRRIAGLNDLVARQSSEARERQEELARLAAELKELRERPVDVAVEADAAAIERARQEVEAAMQDKVDRATAARDAALEKRYELEAALRDAQATAARAERNAALPVNEYVVLFQAMMAQAQDLVNRMAGVPLKVRNRDPERAQELFADLLALAEMIRTAARG